MGTCPCPCCLIPKSWFHQVAAERALLQWMLLQCCDNKDWHDKVVAACRLIYEKHYAVHNSQVKELLKDESLVPTLVSIIFHNHISKPDNLQLWTEHLFRKAWPYWLWFVPYVGNWPTPWVWARGMESNICPFTETFRFLEAKYGSWGRSPVRFFKMASGFQF